MKHVAIYVVIISFLPSLGICEIESGPMTLPAHPVQRVQVGSEDYSRVRVYLESVSPKLHRHKHQEHRLNVAPILTEAESRNVFGWARYEDSRAPSHTLTAQSYCQPWWKWWPPWSTNDNTGLGIDVQALSVLNQSPGGQRPFFSLDAAFNAVMRHWDFWTTDFCDKDVPSAPKPVATLAIFHEPAVGVTASVHFRDPGDMTNAQAQTQDQTIHPLLSAQTDLFNFTINKKGTRGLEAFLEFKLTVAPQLDLYGRFTGKDAQFQWPMQPNIEWHLDPNWSAVFQISIPIFTVGGQNPPPSFAVGILWHAKDVVGKSQSCQK
jgi:hypothetical protein